MKILYYSQFFTVHSSGSGRPYDLSKYLVQAGHEVHVICGTPSGSKPPPWYKPFRNETYDGIKITTCRVAYSNNFGFLRRGLSFATFAILASIAVLFVKKLDIVFASSSPLTIGIPGYIASKLKRRPFIFEIRDILPEAFLVSGAMKPGLASWLGEKLEAFLYHKAVRIMAVSPGFKDRLIERGFDGKKIRVSPLGADGNMFKNVTPDEEFLDKYNLRGKKIAIYTGTHGRANGLDYIVEAAEYTKNNSEIVYVLLGSGGWKERYKQLVGEKGLTNVVFADPVPKTRIPGILAGCAIGLMILRYHGSPRPVLPNKIFDYMFTGIPSIVNFYGPTKDMTEEVGCGVFVDPGDPKDLADKVLMLTNNSEMRHQMGEKGQKIAWQKYDRKALAADVLSIFEEVFAEWKASQK
ncbi:MAG: hypothetical protein CVV39_01340 [Planctomycetes bacterium HGW-Planctomycetes-1]|nr:MAG: hypothetical protein CVV39_01340 [Planctomycetes bacterium HGW-Planctomycetes-1]